jgi:hypothetical protein
MTTFSTLTATILSGAALSGAVSVTSKSVWSVLMPAAWTAADLTFEGSIDGVSYFNIYDGGTEYQLAADANRMVTITKPQLFYALTNIKIRSGTAGTPVNQGADRALSVLVF